MPEEVLGDLMSLVEIRVDPKTDPDGRRLRELLGAVHRIEKLEAIHGLAVHALVVLGVLLWVALVLPHRLPDGVERFGILAFAGAALGLLATLALERHWRRVERRYLDISRRTGSASVHPARTGTPRLGHGARSESAGH